MSNDHTRTYLTKNVCEFKVRVERKMMEEVNKFLANNPLGYSKNQWFRTLINDALEAEKEKGKCHCLTNSHGENKKLDT